MEGEVSAIVNVDHDDKIITYYCEHCSFNTHYYSRLVSHSVVHSCDRPYVCEYCHYAAKRKSDLKKHIIHKHKIPEPTNLIKTPSATTQPPLVTAPPSSSDTKRQPVPVMVREPITYTLSPEQEVAHTPPSVHDDSEDISLHNGSNITTIKLEINDDIELMPVRHIPYDYAVPSQSASSFINSGPVPVSYPSMMFQTPKQDSIYMPVSSHMISKPHTINLSTVSMRSRGHKTRVTSAMESPSQSYSPLTITSTVTTKNASTSSGQSFFCPHCCVLFFDNGLYVMHMGLHNTDNPWQCNICGMVHNDVYSFTLHFITQHKQ